jgi:hypothetical protein
MFSILGSDLFIHTYLKKSKAYVVRYPERGRHREQGGYAAR